MNLFDARLFGDIYFSFIIFGITFGRKIQIF
jgi:hypothetical protein